MLRQNFQTTTVIVTNDIVYINQHNILQLIIYFYVEIISNIIDLIMPEHLCEKYFRK